MFEKSSKIELEFEGNEFDHYGRLLAYVWVDGELYQEKIVREGLSRVGYIYNNNLHLDELMEVQAEAKKLGKYIWSIPTYVNEDGEGYNTDLINLPVNNVDNTVDNSVDNGNSNISPDTPVSSDVGGGVSGSEGIPVPKCGVDSYIEERDNQGTETRCGGSEGLVIVELAPDVQVCDIKGNINSKGDKIYHVPGGASYDKTDAEEIFCDEKEAKRAGYRASKR